MGEPVIATYGVIEGWRFEVVYITKVAQQVFWYRENRSTRDRRAYNEKLVCAGLSKEQAEKLAERLTSAKAECERREHAARRWFHDECARLAARATSGKAAASTREGDGE